MLVVHLHHAFLACVHSSAEWQGSPTCPGSLHLGVEDGAVAVAVAAVSRICDGAAVAAIGGVVVVVVVAAAVVAVVV